MTACDTLLVVIDARGIRRSSGLAGAGVWSRRTATERRWRWRACERTWGNAQPARVRVFVRSEYRRGQFTGGRLDHPLADLCVPGRNLDCEWAAGLDTARAGAIITKQQADAGETEAYRTVVERAVRDGVRQIVLTGFQLTTCVMASALATVGLVGARGARVVVAEALAGARASSYVQTATGSRVDATRRELRAAGVLVAQNGSDACRTCVRHSRQCELEARCTV